MSLNHLDINLTASPCVMVIFGATGDLTKRKLIPALCNLAQDDVLPKQFAIVGFAGNDYDTDSFRKMLAAEIPKYAPAPIDSKLWDWMIERIYYETINVPAALGIILESDGKPADHASILDPAYGGNPGGELGYATAWLAYQLRGDPIAATAFTGTRPELVSNSNWPGSAVK